MEDITDDGFRVTGKGGRQRLIPVHPVLLKEIRGYLDARGIHDGFLFPGNRDGHMSVGNVTARLSRLLGRTTRRTRCAIGSASKAYAGAFDLRAVQELLGHASPATTARYVAVPSENLVNAVLAVPPVPGVQTAPSTSPTLSAAS